MFNGFLNSVKKLSNIISLNDSYSSIFVRNSCNLVFSNPLKSLIIDPTSVLIDTLSLKLHFSKQDIFIYAPILGITNFTPSTMYSLYSSSSSFLSIK